MTEANRTRNENGTFAQETVARFWSQVDQSGDCWIWQGRRHRDGYGLCGHSNRAHRVAWELTMGPVPAGLHVLHRCDNPPCVNPGHLFLGTNHTNVVDRHTKGRSKNLFQPGTNHPRYSVTDEVRAQIFAMRSRGCLQRVIAGATGISRSHIANILTGARRHV